MAAAGPYMEANAIRVYYEAYGEGESGSPQRSLQNEKISGTF